MKTMDNKYLTVVCSAHVTEFKSNKFIFTTLSHYSIQHRKFSPKLQLKTESTTMKGQNIINNAFKMYTLPDKSFLPI